LEFGGVYLETIMTDQENEFEAFQVIDKRFLFSIILSIFSQVWRFGVLIIHFRLIL